MKFSLWTKYGAQNSRDVFNAFAHSLVDAGHDVLYNTSGCDVDVIWSVLWSGRMAPNKNIWTEAVQLSKPVIVLEVGGIKRGTTWKVGLNGINRTGYFGDSDNDRTRADSLGLVCKPWRSNGDYVLVCGQHSGSLQWHDMPQMSNWFLNTYNELRKHTERPILFRSHPRCKLPEIEKGLKNVYRQQPRHLPGTYDDYDMGFSNIWATISYSSNPGIHSIIKGVPAFVGTSSLAYQVANDIDFLHDIEDPYMGERQAWLNDYAWTEFTIEEISRGMPLKRLTSMLE
jgi:hypothetical protein